MPQPFSSRSPRVSLAQMSCMPLEEFSGDFSRFFATFDTCPNIFSGHFHQPSRLYSGVLAKIRRKLSERQSPGRNHSAIFSFDLYTIPLPSLVLKHEETFARVWANGHQRIWVISPRLFMSLIETDKTVESQTHPITVLRRCTNQWDCEAMHQLVKDGEGFPLCCVGQQS